MGQAEFEAFQEVLEQENPDVFKWITGQVPAPSVMLDNPVFQVRLLLQVVHLLLWWQALEPLCRPL